MGELWANHEVGRFLKENKIYMTKLKLMDKMQLLKKQMDEEQQNDADSDLAASTRSIGTVHHIGGRTL